MVTFKQLEAFFWVVQLGGFAQAANKLHTTQSAVSKRIQEVELMFDTKLFDRTLRAARLTDKGEQMFLLAKRLLELRDKGFEQFQLPEVLERRLRIGVTELTAMTWLPRLVEAIHQDYPRVIVEPRVDASMELRDRLLADELDLIIVPDIFDDQRFTTKRVGIVEHAWMCKPGFVGKRHRLRMDELAQHRLLTQDNRSGTGQMYDQWMRSIGIEPVDTILSNSVVALIGLAVSGVGVSYLPRECLASMVKAGTLQVLSVTPPLPKTNYVTLCKGGRPSTLVATVMTMAQKHCNFGAMFQT